MFSMIYESDEDKLMTKILEFPVNEDIKYYTVWEPSHRDYTLQRSRSDSIETMIFRNYSEEPLRIKIIEQGSEPREFLKVFQPKEIEIQSMYARLVVTEIVLASAGMVIFSHYYQKNKEKNRQL